ncbi:PQQ-dependent dehydrogenase, methanol/ethanol family [Sphingobium chlorophenolicum L-1]|uniref:PQQ-dependent dehydrogenase, methanol/ethanol family n=1 Tax=Sphingobium chlorophenolicum L-1 TaxID=690566 RepID=F6EWA3_SPHCR|nr:PQQ-dependent dehydrogenase, methanol/ethanol family [Sphingobium chlorophenolicum]AEG49797.1 PQQ-dependent dehydrogenase, methanol/ethanol family [Sphingobium chlorophenolicum L-1]
MKDHRVLPYGFLRGFIASVGCVMLISCDSASDTSYASGKDLITAAPDGDDWPAYGRTYDEQHFSPLADINERNVAELGLAWNIDLPISNMTFTQPLEVGGVLYYTTGYSVITAVNAATGKELWRYDPQVTDEIGEKQRASWGPRGIAYWNGKIIAPTLGGRLFAVSAATGKLLWSQDTTEGPEDGRFISGAPRVFRGKVIIGHGGADTGNVRGYVTAYNADTGARMWRFHTVPGNPADGFEDDAQRRAAKTWRGEWWKLGGGGTAWNSFTYDAELDRIYVGTGNGAPWNQNIRSPGGGDNLFLSSVVALDANTGKYIWHYQTNPGETWDFNSTMDMTLATVDIDGKSRRILMHAPKNGFFYVLDRDSGKLISAEPFTAVTWAKRIDLKTGRPVENPEARFGEGKGRIRPGSTGGHNWMAQAFSPQTGLLYLPTTERAVSYDGTGIDPKSWQRQPDMVLDSGFKRNPITAPFPAGPEYASALKAWNPVTQKVAWSIPQRGLFNGGVLATAGKLVFQGNAEGHLVAYAADSGKVLWRFNAQNGMLAAPITYRANGRQYLTILTGYGAIAGGMGPDSARLGWDYRLQKRRVLTFMLGGRDALPPFKKEVEPMLRTPQFKVDATLALEGAATFGRKCMACHGPGAIAGGTGPDLRKSAIVPDMNAFEQIVRQGVARQLGMPKFGELGDRDLRAVQHYVRQQAALAKDQ